MERTFILKGLDCPHCSAEIEHEVAQLEGVTFSSVNLMNQTLTVKADDKLSDTLFDLVRKTVNSHEPDVEVSEKLINTQSVTFLLKGLDCPHCSAEIESEVGKLSMVSSSSVNLVRQTLDVDYSELSLSDLTEKITKIVHSHEPDVEVSLAEQSLVEKTENQESKKTENKLRVVRLFSGALIYGAGFALTLLGLINIYTELAIMIIAYIILGGDVLLKAVKNITKGRIFDENFLMTISTIGAFAIGEYPEAVAVMLLYQIGEFFQDYAVNRSRKSISDLMDIRPDYATVQRDGNLVRVNPEIVSVGETIVVKPGEKIPLDGVVISGSSTLDTKDLTGESMPRSVAQGDTALSGCINQNGVLNIEVTKRFKDSTVSKIINLVENASSRKAPSENFITKFARYYTPVVVICALLLAVVPPLFFDGSWADWLTRCFVFLVISCPCALVISIPLTFFGGIGAASRKGVLVKGSNYLELLNNLDTVVFDKTGTLTKGVFKVKEVFAEEDYDREEVLKTAAYAEVMSNHPIAKSIINAYGKTIDSTQINNFREVTGRGLVAEINKKQIVVGSEKLLDEYGITYKQCSSIGTKVYVAVNNNYLGCIVIADEIKEDSTATIANLKKLGIRKTIMLTGDSEEIANAVSTEIGIDEYYAQLLPNNKVEKFEQLFSQSQSDKKLAFVGDGVNDAPVLARADVGIAMGGLGSDAAIEASDVVLMTDEPSKLVDAIKVAKRTKRIVTQNIVFALGIKFLFLVLGAFGIAGMWEAVFGDVGVMILAVLNSMRMLKTK